MAGKSVKGILAAAAVWIVILAALAVATKFLILPRLRGELTDETSSSSQYKNEIVLAADSFSGYCVLRSDAMRNDLKAQGVKLVVEDDAADYESRMKALASRKIQMAVFTIDSFLTSGEKIGKFPATIVMVIDETKGADAIVAFKDAVASVQDLDDPEARIVLTPNSPSEFLARTVIAHFNLPSLPDKWWEEADGAGDVFKKMTSSDVNSKRAYVMWEPYVSRALEYDGAHLLLDSGKLKGYIVDVLVAERTFLRDNPDLVRAVVEAYFRSAYSSEHKTGGMEALVKSDAKATGSESLTDEQARKLVEGIEWKNTLENYAYFGLHQAGQAQHIEDIIANITDVLIKTGAMSQDPLGGKANTIFYDGVLRSLQAANFHPAKKVDVIDGLGLNSDDLDEVRTSAAVRPLSEAEWNKLSPVGSLRIEPISFARGTARINVQSRRDMDNLARKLESWPQYYLLVVGHARSEGDADANLALARERAQEALNYLLSAGVDPNRVRAEAAKPRGGNGAHQSVSFELKQPAY